MTQLHKVYIGVGTNLGDKYQNICMAYQQILKLVGNITSKSSIYVSEPWGFESTEMFLNSVIEIYTSLTPHQLLKELKTIEKNIGRTRKTSTQYQSRIIDLDVLLYDDLIINKDNLTIPHPHFTKRNFVYIPLLEINKNIINPLNLKKVIDEVKIEKLEKFFKKND